MREIKFRAWDGKRMIEPVWTWKGTSPLTCAGKPHSQFFNDFHDKWMFGLECEQITLMQFTGLHDKNGKEIYEGDVVKLMGSVCRKCPLDEEKCFSGANDGPCPEVEILRDVVTMERFPKYWLCNEEFGYEGEDLVDVSDTEVIGNIYENPELVKE